MTRAMGSTEDDVFQIVFVCTANQARSPLAESLFRRSAAGIDTLVSSVGTLELVEPPPIQRARAAVAAADCRRARSRPDPSAVLEDPLGRPPPAMERTAAEIDRLVRRIVTGLFGAFPRGR